MKYYLLFLIILCSYFSRAQNLVPNGDFEDTLFCPTNVSGQYGEQIYALEHWFPVSDSPDYLNSCSVYHPQFCQADVPFNGCGFQYPRSGEGYIGLFTMIHSSSYPNYREYVGVELTQPMVIGTKYYFQMFVSSAYGGPQNIYTYSNNLGVKFSSIFYEAQSNQLPINNQPNLIDTVPIYDTTNWVPFTYEFIADSNYNYLYIGNFMDNASTDTFHVSPNFSQGAYYYIDDVMLTTDSTLLVGLDEHGANKGKIEIFPNPSHDYLNIKASIGAELEVYSLFGELMEKMRLENSRVRILIQTWQPGVYIVKINSHFIKIIKS